MRAEIERWVTTYPKAPGYRDGSFAGAEAAAVVRNAVPNAVRGVLPNLGSIVVEGSPGRGQWTDTPWVALLDRRVTTTVQEEYYIVYLLSLGAERLYLTLAQGCTGLKQRAGEPAARKELLRRGTIMRDRLTGRSRRLHPIAVSLDSDSWRGRLYEPSVLLGIEYAPSELPSEEILQADLKEALFLYRYLVAAGGYALDDEIMVQAHDERGSKTLEQAKRYSHHRSIERHSGHSREVKKRQGTKCKGCEKEMGDIYGEVGRGLIDAHHLVPLASLEDGSVTRFDPVADFAVLCPNCHRVIHRMDDPSDICALRALLQSPS